MKQIKTTEDCYGKTIKDFIISEEHGTVIHFTDDSFVFLEIEGRYDDPPTLVVDTYDFHLSVNRSNIEMLFNLHFIDLATYNTYKSEFNAEDKKNEAKNQRLMRENEIEILKKLKQKYPNV